MVQDFRTSNSSSKIVVAAHRHLSPLTSHLSPFTFRLSPFAPTPPSQRFPDGPQFFCESKLFVLSRNKSSVFLNEYFAGRPKIKLIRMIMEVYAMDSRMLQ